MGAFFHPRLQRMLSLKVCIMKGDTTADLAHGVGFVLFVGHDVEIAFHDLPQNFRLLLS